ncbi:MAG: hypothetical protein H7836_12470 [Magnetococcus sp. YQC-3]
MSNILNDIKNLVLEGKSENRLLVKTKFDNLSKRIKNLPLNKKKTPIIELIKSGEKI